jgi:hypothetical protein
MLEDQGSVNDFLGIHICKDHESHTIHMTQPGLIDSILADIGFIQSSITKHTPSDSILPIDKSNAPWEDKYNYRSFIGKLNFCPRSLDLTLVLLSINACIFVPCPQDYMKSQLNAFPITYS